MDKQIKTKFNLIAIVCIIIFCFAITPITLQNDTFYTIKIGEYILNNGIDMTQDPFSIHEIPYTYPHWLYDVGIYLIYQAGGMTGIYISTVILACILGITVYLTNKKIVKNELVSFLLTLGVMYILTGFVAARAQLVTFILFALGLYFIEQFLETKKKRYAVGLIIIPIIIANVHLAVWPFYFVIFLPYIAEYLIVLLSDSHLFYKAQRKYYKDKMKKLENKKASEEEIRKLQEKIDLMNKKFEESLEKQEQRRKNPYKIKMERKSATKWLIVIMLICLLTGLLTPLGDTPYTYLVKTMQGNTTKSISEHLPMVLIENQSTLTILVIVLAILIFTDTKIRLKDFFMLGGLTVLALMSRRQLSMLTLIGVYSINRLICDLFNKYDPEGTLKFMKKITSGFGAVITILLVILVSIVEYRPKAGNSYVNEASYPVQAVQWLKENINTDEMRLYNEYNYGSYILFQDVKVFIDSRADLYTPEFNGDKNKDVFTDALQTASVSKYYEDTFDKYEITHLLIPSNTKVNMFISRDENYKELYKDDHFIIYERLNK
ncbi:MAG: hypothetical protein J6A04_06335 [Clostridia bacterium]|nr:hypothetical protein [Clostridia bacterium]